MRLAKSWLELAQPKHSTHDYRETPKEVQRSIYGGFNDDYSLETAIISTLTADQMQSVVRWNDDRPVVRYARLYDIA